jgi:hypothetical protein
VQGYCTRINEPFLGAKRSKGRFFGVELEIQFNYTGRDRVYKETAQALVEAAANEGELPRWICKEDSSIDYGYEIVTCPATLDVQRKMIPEILDCLPASGVRAWDTSCCGMHVHVSRRVLTTMQVAKVVMFCNAQATSEFVSRVAGRRPSNWARRKDKKLGTAWLSDDRYEAVNLQRTRSIEFRIFRGSIRLHTILKNIEFCDALTSFAAPAERSLQDSISLDRFIEFTMEQQDRWPMFSGWLAAKWLREETKHSKGVWKVRGQAKETETKQEGNK